MQVNNRQVYDDARKMFNAWFLNAANSGAITQRETNVVLAYLAGQLVANLIVDDFDACCRELIRDCVLIRVKGKEGPAVFFRNMDEFWAQFEKQRKQMASKK